MILMALDHTRDFFGIPGQNPTNLDSTTAALFMTRWVTHFCAPVFFLLTGTSAYLARQSRTTSDLSRLLFTRGLWLMSLDLVIVRCLVYQFNVDYRVTMLLVLWALGGAMLTLSVLVRLPVFAPTAFGIALIAGHNLLDPLASSSPLWSILHGPGMVANTGDHVVFAAYPLIPWVGVTAAGYGLGQMYDWSAGRRQAWLLTLGLVLSLAFLVMRGANGYGDPSPWQPQHKAAVTLLSFLSTTKYPPSLTFLLMTLGPAMLLLRVMDGQTPSLLQPARTLGRVPLFYYVVHFFLIHTVAAGVCLVRYGSAHWMFESADLAHYPFTAPPGWGYPLPIVYAIWASIVIALYPLCAWYGAIKKRSHAWWLSYI